MKTHYTSFHPLSQSFHRAAFFLSEYFPQILFAVALPTLISLIIFWTGFGVTLAEITHVTNFAQLTQLFSWASPTTYMLIMMGLILFALDIIGLIAGPLVLIQHGRITLSQILPKTLTYFFAYLRLGILVALAMILLYVILYLVITILTIIIGLINYSYLEPTFTTLAGVLPNVGIVVMAIFFMFAPFALIQYNQGAYQALAASAGLVRAHFWPIVLRLALVISCVVLIDFLLLFIPYVGYGLSFFFSTLVITTYNYVLFEDVTGVTWP